MSSDPRSEHKHNLSINLQQFYPVTWPGQQSHDVISRSSHWANLIRPIREHLSGSSGLILPLCLQTQEPRETHAGKSSQEHVRVHSGTDALRELERHLWLRHFWSTSDWSHYLVQSHQRDMKHHLSVCLSACDVLETQLCCQVNMILKW